MVRLIALIISIVLQIVAAGIALRFMKLTKYRLSWILLSLSLVFMAVRKIIQLVEYYWKPPSIQLLMIDEWIGVVISVMLVVGIILIREIFYSLKRADIDRIRSERKVIHAILTTEENERKRFAKDLHDGLGPLLSTVKMSLSALETRISDESGKAILANTTHVVNEAIGTIKEVSNNLSPHILTNFGLESAMSSFTAKINQTKTIEILFHSNLADMRLQTDQEVVVYRAACELINNSIKHSGAKKIVVELKKHEKFVTLQVTDNGKGFDTTINDPEMKGMGLSNIATRVRSIDGVFICESSPGKGTSSFIKVVKQDNIKTNVENQNNPG